MNSEKIPSREKGQRYGIFDGIRGITLLSMIIYHGAWDLVYIYGVKWDWYRGAGAYLWQQSICWTFILLSGFCWSMGKRPLKRGLTVFGGGALVSLATCLFMPQNRGVFGVLTLTGSCMLLLIPLQKFFRKVPARAGLAAGALLFVLTRNVNEGYLGFEGVRLVRLPQALYGNLLSAGLGFPPPAFFSTDYFSLIPWFFLFVCGYFLYRVLDRGEGLKGSLLYLDFAPLGFLGRHSLLIYLLHQPVLYLLGSFIFSGV